MRNRNAQAMGRFVIAALTRKSGLVLVALSLLLLLGAVALLDSGSSASASDSETSALIGLFNQYRSQHGVGSLSASSSANADAQAAADKSASKCGYYLPSGHNASWISYSYETASKAMQEYEQAYENGDTFYIDQIGNSSYGSAGVGRAISSNCNTGYIWVIVLDRGGGSGGTPAPTHSPTPFHTASPTPVHTPTATPHTPVPTPTPTPHTTTFTPTATPVLPSATVRPSVTDTPTPGPTDTVTPTPSISNTPIDTTSPTDTPAPTPTPEVAGDVTCGGGITLADVMLLLQAASGEAASSACLHPTGIDCTGGIDATDALTLLEYIEGVGYYLPPGCPALGSTPTPTPSPTVPPSVTPTPIPTAIPAGVNNCELAIVAYHLATAQSLTGGTNCSPGAWTAYDCLFSDGGASATCTASTDAFPDYNCTFGGFGDCVPASGQPEYQCFYNGGNPVQCLPTEPGFGVYDCDVNGDSVTCTADAPFTDFTCLHEAAEFTCIEQADVTPTPTPTPG